MSRRDAAHPVLAAREVGCAPRHFVRAAAQSASPRPHAVRPVDAVRLAKSELHQRAKSKGPKLRLSTLPEQQGDKAIAGAPALHEAFYEFASAVVNPKVTAREHALQLQEWLSAELQKTKKSLEKSNSNQLYGMRNDESGGKTTIPSSQALALVPQADDVEAADVTFLTGVATDEPNNGSCSKSTESHASNANSIASDVLAIPHLSSTEQRPAPDGRVRHAAHARHEVEVCLQVLEIYACDTTTESRERGALLAKAREASLAALSELSGLVKTCAEAAQEATDAKRVLEASVLELENDAAGLRTTMKQMLATEARLQSEVMALRRQIASLEDNLRDVREANSDLTGSLNTTRGELRDLHDANSRGRPVRDACNSPMLGFRAFLVGSDDMLPPGVATRDQIADALLPSVASMNGKVEMLQTLESRKKSASLRSLSLVVPQKEQVQRTATVDIPARQAGGRSRRGSLISARSCSETSNHSEGPMSQLWTGPADVPCQEEDEEESYQALPHPAPSIASLIPFLDFCTVDPKLELARTETAERNQEHLEKHLSMLQEQHQQVLHQNGELQQSMDMALAGMLVWVQAVHASLSDFSSKAVVLEVQALATLRDAIAWLAQRPCSDWREPPELLEQFLAERETLVRSSLAEQRPVDLELVELRQALAAQTQSTEELAEQLLEMRSSAGVGKIANRLRLAATASRQTPLRPTGSALSDQQQRQQRQQLEQDQDQEQEEQLPQEDAREPLQQQDAAVQCELMESNLQGSPQEPSDTVLSDASSGSLSHRAGGPEQTRQSGVKQDARVEAYYQCENTVTPTFEPQTLAVPDACMQGEAVRSEPNVRGQADDVEAVSTNGALVASAVAGLDESARRMRLLRSPFAEAIDLTVVPTADRVLMRPPSEPDVLVADATTGKEGTERLFGLTQLQAFIAEVYSTKKTDDERRDKVMQPRRPLHTVLQELLRRQHGIKSVVHQKSWLLVRCLLQHASTDQTAAMFVDFLDGSRDEAELSFYLYCSTLLSTSFAEESEEFPPPRPISGFVGYARATRIIELLFGDLPRALEVMYAELQKAARNAKQADPFFSDDFGGCFGDFESPSCLVLVEELHRVLLEGWRTSLLLLDNTCPAFSWRRCVLAFMQADVLHRGWLDEHQVRDSEAHRLQLPAKAGSVEELQLKERTSLAAFVFRAFTRCSSITLAEPPVQRQSQVGVSLVPCRGRARREADAACLQISRSAFQTVEKTLGVYLTWLMHSEDLRDLALYHAMKGRIYSFRQAVDKNEGGQSSHHLRCLVLLLLAHQFDMQYLGNGLSADHLQWEFESLLLVLRESWKRGANSGAGLAPGLDLGEELETLAEQ